MGVTGFSFILLPLCLIWIGAPSRLLQLLLIVSVFEAAAALTIGEFGVQPGLVPGFAFIGFMSLQAMLGARFAALPRVWQLTRPFVFVVLWALVSSLVMPRVFEGQVYVWPQRAMPPFVLTALAPSPTNLNQDFYLAINCMFLFLTATFLAGARLPLGPFMRVYFASGYIAAAIAAWQFASRVAGVPFPDAFFYSNPGWSILTEQSMGGVPRINGSFSEPSSLGGYMASIMCATGWLLLRRRRVPYLRLLFGISVATIALSTSSTGFGVLALVSIGVPFYALLTGSGRLVASVLRVAIPLLLLGGILLALLSVLVPGFWSNVDVVVSATLNKRESASYEDRTGTDLDSLAAMVNTFGLGVGWGSNRSSSLLPGLLAGIGIPGMAGLLWFGSGVIAQVRRAHRMAWSDEQRIVMDGCSASLVGFLLGALLSGPTINSLTFFFLLGLLIACVVRVQLGAPAASRRSPAPASSRIVRLAAPHPKTGIAFTQKSGDPAAGVTAPST